MGKPEHPVTAAVRTLRDHGVDFTHHRYTYEARGGTAVSARELGVPEHAVIKTLVMEDEAKRPLVALMHGDREVSTKALARAIGVKTIAPCAPADADRPHSSFSAARELVRPDSIAPSMNPAQPFARSDPASTTRPSGRRISAW